MTRHHSRAKPEEKMSSQFDAMDATAGDVTHHEGMTAQAVGPAQPVSMLNVIQGTESMQAAAQDGILKRISRW